MGWKKATYWFPVVGQLLWLGEKVYHRVKARRARRRGEQYCPDTASDRELFDAGRDTYREGRDAYRRTRGK